MVSRRGYFAGSTSLGVFLSAVFLVAVFRDGISLGEVILIGLAMLTGWLRLRVEPSMHLTLTPLVVFVAMLSENAYIPVVAASFSALVSSRIFARHSWSVALQDMGEETITASAAVLVFSSVIAAKLTAPNTVNLLRFPLAVGTFILTRMTLAGIRSRLTEGLGLRAFMSGPGRQIVLHVLGLSLASLGLSYLANVYSEVKYLILALATVSMVEFYHPWKLLSEQSDILFANLAMIAQAIDLKDPYTARHSRNVADIAIIIARALQLPEPEVKRIRVGALLHDIGKIGISGKIIRKPGLLEPDEMIKMQRHPVISADIMRPIELLGDAAEAVRHHHEHYDGSGYPDGLKGEDIPIGSRVILVADAFDAVTTERPYRRGRSKGEALRVLKEHAGRQFDPKVVKVLESIIDLI